LHKIAPGYNPSGLLLPSAASAAPTFQPTSGTVQTTNSQTSQPDLLVGDATGGNDADPMDDLVSRLEEMESKR
jgi:hypothetical protein